MKILIVNEFSYLQGGVERHLHDLLRHLTRRNFAIDYLCRDQSPNESTLFRGNIFALPQLWKNGRRLSRRTRAKMDAFIRESKPDLVYLHNVENAAVISAMASYAPTIRYVHHHKATCPDGKRVLHYPWACCTYPTAFPCLLRAHLRLCMPRSPYKAWHALLRAKGTLSSLRSLPKLLVASDFMKYVLTRNQIAKDKIDVLPLFSSYPPQEWTAPKSPKGLLFVGRLVHGKGVLELIRLLAKLKPEIHLEIAGDGAMITRARLLTRQYGVQDRVKFSGWLSGNSLMEAYRRNAILIVPALSPEPFGLIGIEAGSFCRPAIAFDVGGIREWLIDGVTGQLVKPEHFDELAGAIEKLVDSPEKLREYGTHARELVTNRFSVEKHLNKLIGLFESTSSSTRR